MTTPDQHAALVADLLRALGEMFDLEHPVAGTTLRAAMRARLLALADPGPPRWGTAGEMTEIAKASTEALEFFYRPHLFPDMDERLRLGHRLQFDLLPRELPATSPLRVSAVLESYCHLSGDLLGWRAERDELVFWIADISGHGVRAGLAAAVLYLLAADIEPGLAPARAAERLGARFLEARNPDDERALYATAFGARVGPDGRGRYASAGHPPMLLRRADGAIERLGATGMPLGLVAGSDYEEEPLALRAGDLLLLFTDGLIEATDHDGVEIGSEWLDGVLDAAAGRVGETARTIYRTIAERTDRDVIEDDLTYLVAARRGDAGG